MTDRPVAADLRVRFSPDIFRVQRHGGVSRYVVELHRGLMARSADSEIVAGLHRSALLAGVPRVRGLDIDRLRPAKVRQGLSRAVDVGVARCATRRMDSPAIWHASYFPPVVPRKALFAVTVYDMIHERYPDRVGARDLTTRYKRPACEAADVIFAISENTAEDLCDRFSIDRDRVVVTPLGVSPVEAVGRPRPFGDEPFLLYVGERRAHHKNWTGLLDALAIAGPGARLVCFGAPEDLQDHTEVASRGLTARVEFAGGDDAELAGWYRAAAALVYPSLYEGFGLPPLEAMAQRCAVVAANTGAIPEVVGTCALLVDPSPRGLADGLAEVLADGPEVERRRDAGLARAAAFTWDETVSRTIEGYTAAVGWPV